MTCKWRGPEVAKRFWEEASHWARRIHVEEHTHLLLKIKEVSNVCHVKSNNSISLVFQGPLNNRKNYDANAVSGPPANRSVVYCHRFSSCLHELPCIRLSECFLSQFLHTRRKESFEELASNEPGCRTCTFGCPITQEQSLI